jgi:hypothetical protein
LTLKIGYDSKKLRQKILSEKSSIFITMDIKKIIQEEVSDFEWIQNVELWDVLDDKFNVTIVDDKLIFTNTNTFEGRIEAEQKMGETLDSRIYKELNPSNTYRWYNPRDQYNRQRAIHQIFKWRKDRLDRFKIDYPKEYKVILSRVTGG